MILVVRTEEYLVRYKQSLLNKHKRQLLTYSSIPGTWYILLKITDRLARVYDLILSKTAGGDTSIMLALEIPPGHVAIDASLSLRTCPVVEMLIDSFDSLPSGCGILRVLRHRLAV